MTHRKGLFRTDVRGQQCPPPTLMFTIHGPGHNNPGAVAVLQAFLPEGDRDPLVPLNAGQRIDICIFDRPEQVTETFANGHRPEGAVAIYDGRPSNQFSMHPRGRQNSGMPTWTQGAYWGVVIGQRISRDPNVAANRAVGNCAEQLRGSFQRNFGKNMAVGEFPWGPPRRGEHTPTVLMAPDMLPELIKRLNDGPDMRAILDPEHAAEIPEGIRFSWKRLPWAAAEFPRAVMEAAVGAVAAFERASSTLLATRPHLQDILMAGVVMDPSIPELRDCYLFPRCGERIVDHWTVRRPDMHVNGDHLVASENDEMPGGFCDLVHLDNAYGINQEAWQACYDFLFEEGPVLFVVSDNWSKPYIPTMRWLTKYLCERGYPARFATTAELDRLEIEENRVLFDGEEIGTVWRQFPVFETTGPLAQLVLASQRGAVRMFPEFAHFGSKSWFSLFWMEQDAFRELLSPGDFELLQTIMPQSHVVRFAEDEFPMVFQTGHPDVPELRFNSFEELLDATFGAREHLVLKITGANDQAARSYGVFMGHARSEQDWRRWLEQRCEQNEPFIVQWKFDTSVEQVGVFNVTTGATELFDCKVLLRPWVVNGNLVSSHNACTPHWTTKVHGMTDMAVVPVEYY